MSKRVAHLALVAVLLASAGCKQTLAPDEGPATSALGVAAKSDPPAPPAFPSIEVGQRPDPSTDEGGLWLQSDRFEKRAGTAGNRIDDPALNAYVADIVCRLAGPYCGDVRVYLVRAPHFNAFMAPNGMMSVWSGLLLRARNEAQLAAVLGHEIGHYLRRHSVQQWRKMVNTSGFLQFFAMGMVGIGGQGAADLVALMAAGTLSSFSRDNEREADTLGVDRMAAAGYDPRQAAKIWENLIREHKDGEVEREFSFFLSTHPHDEDRQSDLLERAAAEIARTGTVGETGTERYRKAIAPHRFSLLRDEIHQGEYKRSLALVDHLLEDGFRPGELHFFRGELHRLRDDEDEQDREKALGAYRTATTHADCPPETYRSLGLLNRRLGRNTEAADSLRRYLSMRPDAPDAPFLRSYLQPTS